MPPAFERFMHRADYIFMALALAAIPISLLPTNWWGRILGIAFELCFFGTIVASWEHSKANLCEYCMFNGPTDGPAEARKRKRKLRTYHRLITPLGAITFFTMILGPALLPPIWIGFIARSVIVTPFLWVLWSMRVHTQLQAWCPDCHPGGGGGHVHEPSPDPSVNQPI